MSDPGLALVLSGGGARAAYQVGFLKYLASHYPDLMPGTLTGVSAGGINATYLACHEDRFVGKVNQLHDLWSGLRMDDVFRVDAGDLASRVTRWGFRLVSGSGQQPPRARSLVDTTPLRELLTRALNAASDGTLPGIARSLAKQRLRAVALTGSSYTTGQSVTWVQSEEGCGVMTWERPQRKSTNGCLTVDHVMASSALPFFFPAVEIEREWYGDGGIRLTAPLSPAIHLGAEKIIAISTRYAAPHDTDTPVRGNYPPPAQVAGVLLNAVFLDLLDADALRLQQLNALIDRVPRDARGGLRPIDLLILRPSQDLGLLANQFEPALPRPFRFLVRSLGSRQTRSNDMLSLLMFQPDYIAKLMELGEADARARSDQVEMFIRQEPASAPDPESPIKRYLRWLRKE